MEKMYENEELDKLMDKYNFDLPIKVTLVIEEGPPEPVILKNLLDSNSIYAPNSNFGPSSSEGYKIKDSNIGNPKNKIPNEKENCKSVIEENNHSISVNKTVFPERRQENSQDIQWQLLDAVADNLIHITKYYFYNFVNITVEIQNYERLKLEYITIKHHFFNLSYCTAVAILLPREDDTRFINYFIHRVIRIANRISWYQISYEILNTLIRQMLTWTKQKKIHFDKQSGSHDHERNGMDWSSRALAISNELNHSRQASNRPFDNSYTTNDLTRGTNRKPDNVRNTHIPEQVMNISPHIRHVTNYLTQELTRLLNISPRINNPSQDIDAATNNSHIKDNAAPKGTKELINNCSKTFHSQPELNISPSPVQRTIHSNQGTSSAFNIDRRINNSMEGISRLPFVDSRMNHSSETITSIYDNEPKTNNVSSCQDNININDRHVNKAYGTNSIKKRKTDDSRYNPYINTKSTPQSNENNSINKQNNCSATTFKSPGDGLCHEDSRKAEYDLLNTDTFRSSVSRDSGLGSPMYGIFRNEETIDLTSSEEQETPIISHVTSLNPSAVHLNVGFCKVCGATTNNICIECNKEYYCSFSCQTKDLENRKCLCSG